MNLDSFLKLPQDEISNLIINYLLQRKVSRQYRVVIFSAIKHACEMNDVIRKDGEPSAPDDDQFGSCHECGNTVPIYTAHYESEIKDSLQTVSNPFESNESVFLSTTVEQLQGGKEKVKANMEKVYTNTCLGGLTMKKKKIRIFGEK
jgi:hypothetical protein